MDDRLRELPALKRAIDVLKHFSGVLAVGIAGSHSRGVADRYSDFDLHVFMQDEIPALDKRRSIFYANGLGVGYCGFDHICSGGYLPPISVDFVMDDVMIDGTECSFLWMNERGMVEIYAQIAAEPSAPEGLVGVMKEMIALNDPDGIITRLQEALPQYSVARAIGRAKQAIGEARFYRLGIEKALYRHDFICLHQYEDILLRNFVKALYALNRTWFIDEKRFYLRSKDFDILPRDCLANLESIIRRAQPFASLSESFKELIALFTELSKLANQRYLDCSLPTDWAI